ncbi:MAG: diguanylate cyclase [Thermoleophilia bacterium]
MTDQSMIEIMEICLHLDSQATLIYRDLAFQPRQAPLKDFWLEMSEEEKEHTGFWTSLINIAREDILPQVFEQPQQTLANLGETGKRIDDIWERRESDMDIQSAFILAYRLEFYLMHPAFETLFQFAGSFPGSTSPEETYGAHIEKFIQGMNRFAGESQELELLGKTLMMLWSENRNLIQISITDELTGLLNRRGFFAAVKPMLHLAQRNGNTVSVMMADIDDFKKVNDTYGHEAGDEVLRRISRAIREAVRESDLVGRYGGEEFIILFSTILESSVLDVARKIQSRIEAALADGPKVTLSMGIAENVLDQDVEHGMHVLISRADDFLYQAKRAGKDQIVMAKTG